MAVIRSYPEILLIVVLSCFLVFLCFTKRWVFNMRQKTTSSSSSCSNSYSCLPTKWPVVGMLPGVLQNAHRIHDSMTEVLKESGGTFKFEGPFFTNMDMLITSHPANIRHILTTNFLNYPKGPAFKEMFDILGDGIFNADSELWESQRKMAMSLLSHPKFLKFVGKSSLDKSENGLIPILESVSKLKTEVDLQELFERFTFDNTCKWVFGQDPSSLSIDLPYLACEKAFGDAEEAVFYRHILPESFWKLQRWLQAGKEKNYRKAWLALDEFIYQCISVKKQEKEAAEMTMEDSEEDVLDMLSAYMKTYDNCSEKFLRDSLLNFVFAGRDTTSSTLTWFFSLIASNPSVEEKVLQEIALILNPKNEDYEGNVWLSSTLSNIEELKKMVYLHAAICESLRLLPPVPLQHKASVQADILPSGDKVGPNTKIVLSYYAMGRMEKIWGKDCLEFKPERWITEQGGIKYEPSFKFTAFNTGPRTCLGKDMTFIQMKIVVAAIIFNYHIQMVEGHPPISPSMSVVLHMKDGLKVRVTKRRRV